MDTLIIYGLIALGGLSLLRALFPARPTPPPIIYVQAAPTEAGDGTGCLPLLILVGVVLLALNLA